MEKLNFTEEELNTILSVCKTRLSGIRGYSLSEEDILDGIIKKIEKLV